MSIISNGSVEKHGLYTIYDKRKHDKYTIKNFSNFEKLRSESHQMSTVCRSDRGTWAVDIFGTLYYGGLTLRKFTDISIYKLCNYCNRLVFLDNDGNLWCIKSYFDQFRQLQNTTHLVAKNVNIISFCVFNDRMYFYVDTNNNLFIIISSHPFEENNNIEIHSIKIPEKIISVQKFCNTIYILDVNGDIWVTPINFGYGSFKYLSAGCCFEKISSNKQFMRVLFTGNMKYAIDFKGRLWAHINESWICILSEKIVIQISFCYEKIYILDLNKQLWETNHYNGTKIFSNNLTLIKSNVDYIGDGTEKYVPKISKWH